ncbi:MAG TPA: DUF1343 domain-containing protein, partial [Saprospiraceae bacterium]|nr:DUF1343 domain-containing protein [Saprospiraceae bacterium]
HPEFQGDDLFQFTPEDRPEAANPPWEGKTCKGVRFLPADLERVKSGNRIQLGYLLNAYQNTPRDTTFFLKGLFFDKLAGTDQLRKQILENQSEDEIRASWQKGLRVFKAARKKYLLYPE